MIHKYKLGDYNIVLDVNSGGVHVVDELTYDMLDNAAAVAPVCPPEVVEKLSAFYAPEEIRPCYAEVLEVRRRASCFRRMTTRIRQLAVASPIKAMCLNIAHDQKPRCKTALPPPAISARAESSCPMKLEKGSGFPAEKFGKPCQSGDGLFGGEPLMNFLKPSRRSWNMPVRRSRSTIKVPVHHHHQRHASDR